MLSYSSNRLYVNLFENITDLSQYLITKERKPGRDNASETGDSYFTGTSSYDEAFELMRYGDEKMLEEFKKLKSKININKLLGNAIRRQKYENRIYGCVPNVPAYLLGYPLNMINPEIGRISHKVINIFLNIGVPARVSPDDIIKNGVIYLSIIDLLEKAGYRCNLYAGDTSIGGGEREYMYVRIKTDREPLNIKKIVFVLANPSMLRRIFFKWLEVNDSDYDMTDDSYGAVDTKENIIKNMKKVYKEDFIVWKYNDDTTFEAKQIKEIIEGLKKQGIDLEIGD